MTSAATALVDLGIVAATVVAMEVGAWATHKYIMHGWGWGWHSSHHRKNTGVLEKNDLYAVVFAGLAIVLFTAAPNRHHWSFWLAVGITVYGILYGILHDGLVHRRWPVPPVPSTRYLRRLMRAHRLHHATADRAGAVSFGFLYAPPIHDLIQKLRVSRAMPK